MRRELIDSLKTHQSAFNLDLATETLGRLGDFYDLIQEHNPILHLVAPCSAEEFAVRHILESLLLMKYLPENAIFADVGTGAGLPSIPCMIAREDLSAVLIESKEKKARFLKEAVAALGIDGRAAVVSRQFEEVKEKDFRFVTSRALDKFTERLPRLLKWSGRRPLCLFGGESLGDALQRCKRAFEKEHIPLSEKRYLFVVGHVSR